jgi:trans-aconitate methyltransferase
MFDQRTIDAYDADPSGFARDWDNQPEPTDVYRLVAQYFAPGPTADIGCGSGRDTAWLVRHGFPAIGFDASTGLLGEARLRSPTIEFEYGALPDLAQIGERRFTNVFCETVIMHLAPHLVGRAVGRLLEILEPGGTVFLSWRTSDASQRDSAGRLYTSLSREAVLDALAGATILYEAKVTSESSGRAVRRLIARNGSGGRTP